MKSSTSLPRTLRVALLLVAAPALALALSADLQKKLDDATYVYISSTRKDGTLSRPAEIWFMTHEGAVYVGTPANSWRVKRIKAGRPKAKIWVGAAGGANMRGATEKELAALPSFTAAGALVKDPKIEEKLYEIFAKKYTNGWGTHEERFRKGFADGSRVIVKYTPD